MWSKSIIYSTYINASIVGMILNNCPLNYKEGIWFIIHADITAGKMAKCSIYNKGF